MSAAVDEMKLCCHASLIEKLMEMFTLAYRNHIVRCTVEHHYRRIGWIDVCCSVESLESLLISLEREAHHGLLRSMIPVVNLTAAAHVIEVCRA
jgi:hypothetical protein